MIWSLKSPRSLPTALGVGIKALPGLKSVETPDTTGEQSDYSLAGIMQHSNHVQFDGHAPVPDRTTSALHSIMEQGDVFRALTGAFSF
jgi:osomolarity two-component system, sensor histidine kinase SLN1